MQRLARGRDSAQASAMRRSEPILGVALLAALAVVQEGHPTTHGHGVGSPRHHPWELPPGSRYTLKDLKRATAGVFPGRMASVARMSWRRLAETLDAGERAVTVAGLGSSVLGAHGGCTEALPALKPLCGNCCTPTGGQPPPQMTGEFSPGCSPSGSTRSPPCVVQESLQRGPCLITWPGTTCLRSFLASLTRDQISKGNLLIFCCHSFPLSKLPLLTRSRITTPFADV